MSTAALMRTAALVGLMFGAALAPLVPAGAADSRVPVLNVTSSDANASFVPLGVGKSVAIDLPADIKDVLVADPKIANAVVRSARRVYIIGVTVGQTNIFFFDAQGRQIAGFDIAVTRDLNGVRAAFKRIMPDADIHIEGVGADGIVLSGSAASQAEAQKAYDIAARLVGDGTKVVNGIMIRGRDQVMLKVTVAEVQRDVIKQLGIDLSGSFKNVTATLRAMERAGVIRTLAEPNLTAISGETASFLAGGEFPFVKGTSGPPSFTPTVEFKKFGVSLIFTPVVLSEGRISLKVLTEMSELSTEGALSVAGGISIPSLKTRRAETVVEIPSGGSLALAGMIQEQTKQSINGLPGLLRIPILGTLFKSRDYINHNTELMILVTPYVVRAVAQKELARPDDGFADSNDPSAILLGRLNRIYGAHGKTLDPTANYHGKYGFILD